MRGRLHFFEPTQVPADAVDCARASGAVTELQAQQIVGESEREADWLLLGAVFVLALVSAVSWVWPWGFGK